MIERCPWGQTESDMSSAYVMIKETGSCAVNIMAGNTRPDFYHPCSSPSCLLSPRGPEAHKNCFSQHSSPSQNSSHNIFTTSKAGTSLASTQTQQKSRGCFRAHRAGLHTKYTGRSGMGRVSRCRCTDRPSPKSFPGPGLPKPHHHTTRHPAGGSLNAQPPKQATGLPPVPGQSHGRSWAYPGGCCWSLADAASLSGWACGTGATRWGHSLLPTHETAAGIPLRPPGSRAE